MYSSIYVYISSTFLIFRCRTIKQPTTGSVQLSYGTTEQKNAKQVENWGSVPILYIYEHEHIYIYENVQILRNSPRTR